jgi:hypothetical protein
MRLRDLQHLFQDGLFGGAQEILDHVRGNTRADATAMFGVYRHAYWSRLTDVLGGDYPGLKALAGEHFTEIARAYVARHPSVTPSIRWAGRLLPQFLRDEAPYRDDPWLADMARLDWALAHAFDAADAPAIGVPELATIPAELWGGLKLSLHPTLDLFPVTTPVDVLRPLLLNDARAAFDRSARQDGGVMAWRIGHDLKFRAIPAREFSALGAMRAGATFGDVCEMLSGEIGPEDAAPEAAGFLRYWLDWGIVRDIDAHAPGSA